MASTIELRNLAKELLEDENNREMGRAAFDAPPIPFFEYQRLSFPTEALPDWAHDMVKALAIAYQVPEDMAGMILLATLAAAVSKRYKIQARPGWTELLGLYASSLLETGNRKTGTLRELSAPVEYFEQRLVEQKRPVYEMQKHELDTLKARMEDLKKSYVKARNGTDRKTSGPPAHEIWQEIEVLSKEISETPEPSLPTILTGDATEEKMVVIAAGNDGYMAHFSAEGELFANAAGRYNSQVPKFEVLLKGYSGDPIRQDRIGRAPQYIPEPCFTVLTVVQPIVLKELAQKPEFRHKGLLGRFLYSVPLSPLGQRQINPEPIPEEVKNRYWTGILRLLTDTWGNAPKEELTLSADANILLADFERELEPKLGPEGELRPIVDWAAKLAGSIVRIAGILHLADHAGDRDKPLIVPGETMQRALLFAPYLINHAKIAYALMDVADTEEISKARRVIRWITDNKLTDFTQRDCQRALQSVFRNAEEVKSVLKLLVEHDYICESDDEPSVGPGRRKSVSYKINPLMTEMTEMTEYTPEASSVNSVKCVTKRTNLKSEVGPLTFCDDKKCPNPIGDLWAEVGIDV